MGPSDLFDIPPERSSGYTSIEEQRHSGGGADKLRINGKANGRAAVGVLPSLSRPLSGQCNHLADGCECFRENGFPHLSRKVGNKAPRILKTGLFVNILVMLLAVMGK
jgi:hypothetical protein